MNLLGEILPLRNRQAIAVHLLCAEPGNSDILSRWADQPSHMTADDPSSRTPRIPVSINIGIG